MADKIVAEYNVEVDLAVKNLNKVANSIDQIDKERKETQKGFKTMSKSMVDDFKSIGAAIGVAFGAQELVSFGKEAVKLASQMEGVERAFKRIGGANSANLLEGLRRATRGTVSDLQLMQKAVQASNFKIPLENLASLFQFAQARARETGESVEYLTNSIVLGIGRKSPLILDNLGISAVELRERLKGVGVEASSVGDIAKIIGDIAEEELAKMGDQADTTADKIEQLSAAFENFKLQVGQELISTFSDFNDEVSELLELFDIEGVDAFGVALGGLKAIITGLESPFKVLIAALQQVGYGWQLFLESVGLSDGLLGDLKKQLEETGDAGYTMADGIGAAWAAIKAGNVDVETYSNTINQLNKELKAYQDELKDAEIGSTEFFAIIDKITAKTKELNDAVAMTKLADALKVDAEEELDITGEVIEYGEEVERVTDYADKKWEDHFNKLMAAQDEAFANEKRIQQERAYITQEVLSTAGQFASTISQIVQNQITADLQALQKQFEEGEITREEFEQKQRELQRKSAQAAKDAALFNAVINTAQAVMQALANVPPPASYALAAVAGALGAAQIAAIASQPLPQFAEGGFVNQHGEIIGRSHAQGGVLIEAEGNEFITKGKYAQQNADILKAINSGDWEKYKMENIIAPAINQVLEGGFGGLGASYMLNTNWTDKNLLKQGDRNRYAMRDGFVYLGKEIRSLKGNQSRWN